MRQQQLEKVPIRCAATECTHADSVFRQSLVCKDHHEEGCVSKRGVEDTKTEYRILVKLFTLNDDAAAIIYHQQGMRLAICEYLISSPRTTHLQVA